MSAWYLFSAVGFYPVNPVSGDYVVGAPFFDKVVINLPGAKNPLVIFSKDAPTKPYVSGLSVNGETINTPILKHEQIRQGAEITFNMSDIPQQWCSATLNEPL